MTTTLTKEQFITRSMTGEKFEYDTCIYYYDKDKANPFRVDEDSLAAYWQYMDGETEFIIVEPEPTIERRWRWLLDGEEYTVISSSFMSDNYVKNNSYMTQDWYKSDQYIEVEIK